VPHLTLGRARGRPIALEAAEASSAIPGFTVHNVELVESVLDAAGSAYATLATYLLSESRDQRSD
jgi:RNA 2',3'-cyclic 3'-phosphodiesterase